MTMQVGLGARLQAAAFAAEYFEHVNRDGITAHGRADLCSLYQLARGTQHLARDGDAFSASGVSIGAAAHALDDAFRDRDLQLVLHEFSIADALQRPDAGHDRDAAVLDALEEDL